MTRVEVERECDKRGWLLEDDGEVVLVYGPEVEPGVRHAVGGADTPYAAFLAACKATDTVPF